MRKTEDHSPNPEFKTSLMKKAIIIAVALASVFHAQTAAAQLYTCTGQNNACTLCDFFAMLVKVIGITLKFVVPSAIILAVVAAGVMMMLKQENPDVWGRAKKIMLTAIIGGLIAYGGWLLVSVSLAGMNFANKDTWWKFELVCTYCGDGILQTGEECEPGLSDAPCDESCKIIAEQKPVVQDHCGTANGGKDLTDPGVSFDIVRAYEFTRSGGGRGGSYTCDEVCVARGQKCIGVGLTNPAVNACVSVADHIGLNCELSENLKQGSGCSDTYIYYAGRICLEFSSPCKPEWEPCTSVYADTEYVDFEEYPAFTVGETACYCQ